MIWILVSKQANQLTCGICPYVYYDERTEWYKCKLDKHTVHTCVWDDKRSDKCTIQVVTSPPAPAADVAPVARGTKIPCTSVEDWARWCKCSVCGYDGLFIEDKFCSQCGARLEE